MNSIGGPGQNPYGNMQRMSPEMRIGQEIQNLANSGEISTEDKDALSSALFEIGSALKSTRPANGVSPPSRDELQTRIEGLISDQVEAGTLTEEQADQLSEVFETVAQGRPDGGAGPKGPRPDGAGGPPPQDGFESEADSLLTDFLQQLHEQSATGYGSDGDLEGDSSFLFSYSA